MLCAESTGLNRLLPCRIFHSTLSYPPKVSTAPKISTCSAARAAFTPLVFSASGGASKLATMFLKRLASVLAEKRKEPYSVTMAWLRTRLSFSLLRSAIACLRSSRRKFWGDDLEIHPVLAAGQAWL